MALQEMTAMESVGLNWIANFIWGIADDVLRDLYVRGKYRDMILPMTVLRRFDAVLEPTKQAVLDMKTSLDKAGIVHQDQALRQAAGQAFYDTSKFTLRDLRARAGQQQLKADFEAYLDGFSPNVQEILDNFEFRNQIPRLSKADALGTLIEKFLDPNRAATPKEIEALVGARRDRTRRRSSRRSIRKTRPPRLPARAACGHYRRQVGWSSTSPTASCAILNRYRF